MNLVDIYRLRSNKISSVKVGDYVIIIGIKAYSSLEEIKIGDYVSVKGMQTYPVLKEIQIGKKYMVSRLIPCTPSDETLMCNSCNHKGTLVIINFDDKKDCTCSTCKCYIGNSFGTLFK